MMLRAFTSHIIEDVCSTDPSSGLEHAQFSKRGLFFGASGVAYFLLQASRSTRVPELMRDADRYCTYAEGLSADSASNRRDSLTSELPLNIERSVATGSAGVGYTRALLSAEMRAPDGVARGIDTFGEAWVGTEALAGTHADLHFGAAGFACAATDLLERLTDLPPGRKDALERVRRQSGARLLEYLEEPFTNRSDHVGMAHGVSGALYASLRASVPTEIVVRRIDELIDLAIDQPPLIQWPATVDTRYLDDLPTSFCRGLSGVLTLLCAATRKLRSERCLQYAARAAFMLRKLPAEAPGICCGAAGQAVAVDHYATVSGCSTNRRWARERLRAGAKSASACSAFELWQGKPGIALAALAFTGQADLPLVARP